MTIPQIKGVCVRSSLHFLEEKGLLEDALDQLPEHFQAQLRSEILPAIWYPLEPFADLLEAVRVPYSKESKDIHVELGGRLVHDGINSTLRGFFRAGAIQWFIKRSPIMWNVVFRGTELEIEPHSRTSGNARVVGDIPASRALCRTVGGAMTEALLLTGADDVRVEHVKCKLDGADECVFRATWSY